MAPRGTLAPGEGEGTLARKEGPFGVVFASPKGQTADPSEVTIVWNRPMRALSTAGEEATPPVVMRPAVPGQWMWVGTSAVSFTPKERIPRATEITVEVPAGTKALDGSVMDKPYAVRFSTARPKLEYANADPQGSEGLEPGSKISARFNQPIDEAEVARALRLTAEPRQGRAEGPKPVPFTVRRPDPKNEQLFEIVPGKPLPLDATIRLEADPTLRGREGPLLAARPGSFEFHTYGPLVVERLDCSNDGPKRKCGADSGISLTLTGPVKVADLKRALRIEPPVKVRWPSWMEDSMSTSSLNVYARFVPGRTYRVSLGTVKDTHGQALARPFSQSVQFDDLWPSAAIGVRGAMLEPTAARAIPVASVNLGELTLVTAPIDEELLLATLTDQNSPGRDPTRGELLAQKGAKEATLKPTAAANSPATHLVRPEDVLGGKDKRGPMGILVEYTSTQHGSTARTLHSTAVAQVTDLAISAKLSPHGSLVWVTRLGTGAPVAGAKISVVRPAGRTDGFVTDKDGLVAVPKEAYQPLDRTSNASAIIARLGDDWTYRRTEDLVYTYRQGVYTDMGPEMPFGMLFTDRGIYRPGDTVHVKGIFRQEAAKGTETPAGRNVQLVFDSPQGETFSRQTFALSAFGTLSADVKVPETGRLGTYSMRASVDGSPRTYPDVSSDFEVAEYRAAEFKVSVQSDKASFVRGDQASWTARGDYLFGAPMSGSDAWLHVTRSPTSFTPRGVEGYFTDDETFWSGRPEANERGYEISNTQTKLDKKGAATALAPLTMPGQRGPEMVSCEANITDLSRQSIAGSTSAIVHPGEVYLALKPGPELFVKVTDALKPEVLAVDPQGAKVSGVSATVELVRRSWTVARQQVGGGFRTSSEIQDKVVSSCSLTTGSAPASCSVQPSGPGYYIMHVTAKDKRGNAVGASAGIYATSDVGETSWADNDSTAVDLVPDRKSYEVGQTARILVKSPFKSADALVTVERAGVYTQRRVTLSGPMPTVSVPITDDLRPNAFVSVLLLRGRTKAAPAKAGAPDVGAPAFRLGYAALPINPEARRLAVAVKPAKAELRPGDDVVVDVEVKDRAGKPAKAEVTLYAVDEGVLTLIGYKTPDPIGTFGAARNLKVATVEARTALAKLLDPFAALGIDKGLDGGGGGEGSGVRRDFRAGAYWGPSHVTDAGGRVHATFKLPDTLTTYRIMAVAVAEDDRFGYGQDRVVSSRPLMARPAFPRFLRAGDSIEAGVVLTSKGLPKTRVEVEIAAEGLTVKGEAKRAVELDESGSAEVRFAIEAPRAGKAKVTFRASGGGAEDRVEITRDVKIPMVMEAAALYGDTTSEAAEKLGDLSGIRDDVGGLDVSLSSTALVGLNSGMEQLIDYPYGCTEQLTSRLVPLLPLRDLARDYKVSLPGDLDRVVARTVAEIQSHQNGDGGFGMWSASSQSYPWTTAYAVWGLHLAKKYGAPVSEHALKSGLGYLRSQLGHLYRDDHSLAAGAFIVDVLAEAGAPDPGRVTQLFESREKLPAFSQALLLHAMVATKSDPAGIDKLASELEGLVRLDASVARVVSNHGDRYATLMDSDARTSALVLRALLAARPEHPLAARLAMGLLAARKGGTWRSTQESAWALLALDEYRKVQEKAEPDFIAHVFVGPAEVGAAAFHGRSLEQGRSQVATAKLTMTPGAPIGFTVEGRGRLFYEARLRYAKKALPRDAIDRGFFVKKTLRSVRPEALADVLRGLPESTARAFRGADLVLGDIVVVTPSPREFVVIDDPLPAGFEAVDARLATTGSSADIDRAADRSGADDDRDADDVAAGRGYDPSNFVREIRDDRVLFFVDHMSAGMFHYRYLARATTLGTFVLPPTKAEEMYTPEIFGRTGADSIVVAGR